MDLELKRVLLSLCGIAAITTATGCVCFPFATPPMELSGGGAVAATDGQIHGAFPLEASGNPLGLAEDFWDRNVDFGVGYRVTPTTIGDTHHGPIASLSLLVPVSLHEPFEGESDLGLRFAFTGKGQVVIGNEVDRPGMAATFRFTSEWVGWDNGPFDTCATDRDDYPPAADLDGDGYPDEDDEFSCGFGHSFGEVGLGVFAEATYMDLGGQSLGWVGIGLSFRIPAAAGIAIASVLD